MFCCDKLNGPNFRLHNTTESIGHLNSWNIGYSTHFKYLSVTLISLDTTVSTVKISLHNMVLFICFNYKKYSESQQPEAAVFYTRYLTGTLWSWITFLMEFLSDLSGVLMNLPGIIWTIFSSELKSLFKNLSGTLWRNIQRSSSFWVFVIFSLNWNGEKLSLFDITPIKARHLFLCYRTISNP